MKKDTVVTSESRRSLACYVVGVLLIIYLLIASTLIIAVHLNVISGLARAVLLRAHVLCAGFGMLGATMAAMRKYYRSLITESTARLLGLTAAPMDWSFGWVYYYITRPLLGALLGALTFTLSFVGFQMLSSPGNIEISSKGRYLLFALGFVSGFAVSHVLDRLDALAKRVFRPNTDLTEKEN